MPHRNVIFENRTAKHAVATANVVCYCVQSDEIFEKRTIEGGHSTSLAPVGRPQSNLAEHQQSVFSSYFEDMKSSAPLSCCPLFGRSFGRAVPRKYSSSYGVQDGRPQYRRASAGGEASQLLVKGFVSILCLTVEHQHWSVIVYAKSFSAEVSETRFKVYFFVL